MLKIEDTGHYILIKGSIQQEYIIINIKDPKISTKNLLDIISTFSKAAVYKINI
jgi:hypothetical protein